MASHPPSTMDPVRRPCTGWRGLWDRPQLFKDVHDHGLPRLARRAKGRWNSEQAPQHRPGLGPGVYRRNPGRSTLRSADDHPYRRTTQCGRTRRTEEGFSRRHPGGRTLRSADEHPRWRAATTERTGHARGDAPWFTRTAPRQGEAARPIQRRRSGSGDWPCRRAGARQLPHGRYEPHLGPGSCAAQNRHRPGGRRTEPPRGSGAGPVAKESGTPGYQPRRAGTTLGPRCALGPWCPPPGL